MAAATLPLCHLDDVTSCLCRFSDLFSLAEEFEDSQAKPPKSRRKAPASSPRSRKGPAPPTTATEEESNSSSPSVPCGGRDTHNKIEFCRCYNEVNVLFYPIT